MAILNLLTNPLSYHYSCGININVYSPSLQIPHPYFHLTFTLQLLYEGMVKSSRPNLCETQNKSLLVFWLFWSQPMALWAFECAAAHIHGCDQENFTLLYFTLVTPAPVQVPTQRPRVLSFTSV